MNILTTIGTICFSVFAVFGIFMFLGAIRMAYFRKGQKEKAETEERLNTEREVQPAPASNDISQLVNNVQDLTKRIDSLEDLLKDWGAIKSIHKIPDLDVKLSYPIGYESTETTNQK